jgi:hypothetical protein
MGRASCAIASVTLVAAGTGGSLAAQASDALYARFTALGGWEARGYTFDPGIGVKSVWQWNVPLVMAAPLDRRVSIDLTTHYASGHIDSYGGGSETLSGLTDTQVRLLYTVNRDRLVGSLSFNLPTGRQTVSTSQFQVAGAVGANYLSFPVSSFGTAFGVTGGVAYAERLGAWNVGVSSSLRYLGTYEPFANDTLSYKPGWEGRLRAGADRLLGETSRLLLGLTVSTFSTDVYSGSSALVSGWYDPGTRFIGELGFARVVGRSTLTFSAWDYYRLVGLGATGPNPETKENVFDSQVRFTHPVTPRVQIEPMLAFRQWSPADYRGGRLKSGGLLARAGLTDRLSATVAGRYDDGWIYARGRGFAFLRGYGASLFMRYER